MKNKTKSYFINASTFDKNGNIIETRSGVIESNVSPAEVANAVVEELLKDSPEAQVTVNQFNMLW